MNKLATLPSLPKRLNKSFNYVSIRIIEYMIKLCALDVICLLFDFLSHVINQLCCPHLPLMITPTTHVITLQFICCPFGSLISGIRRVQCYMIRVRSLLLIILFRSNSSHIVNLIYYIFRVIYERYYTETGFIQWTLSDWRVLIIKKKI